MRSPRGLLPCLLTHFYFALAFKGVTFSATCDAFSQGKTVARFEKCHSFVIDDDGGLLPTPQLGAVVTFFEIPNFRTCNLKWVMEPEH